MSDLKKNQFSTTQSDQETQSSKRKTIADADEDLNLGQMRPLQSSPLRYDVSNGLGNYQLTKLNEKSVCLGEFAESDKENMEAEVLKTPETKLNSLVTCISDTDLTPIDLSMSPRTKLYLQKRTDDSSTKFKTSYHEIGKSPINDYLKATTEAEEDLMNDFSITKAQLERLKHILLGEERPLNLIIRDAQNSESKSLYETIDLTSRSSSACSSLIDTLTAADNEMVNDVSLVIIDIDSDEENATVKRGVDGSSADTLMEPQPKKSKNNKLDYDEMLYIGQEVSDLISPLPDAADADDKKNANLMANTPLVSNESLEQQEAEANRILDRIYKTEVVPETADKEADDAENVMDQKCFNNLTVIADTSPMSPVSQITDRMSSNSNDYELLLIQQEVADIIPRLFDDDTSNESLDHPLTDEDYVLNQRYYAMLPYQTSDPEIIKRQRTTLKMLINNNICTDKNFKIFIAEPDAYKDEANRILDQVYNLDNIYQTDEDDDAELPMDPESLNNSTVVADAAPMSLDNQIYSSSVKNDSAASKNYHPGVAEFSAVAGTSSTTRESLDNILGNNLKPIDDRQDQIDADEVEPSSL